MKPLAVAAFLPLALGLSARAAWAQDTIVVQYAAKLPGPITPWTPVKLLSDQALEIECTDSLVQIGRYTALAAPGRVQTMAIDRVPPRRTVLLP